MVVMTIAFNWKTVWLSYLCGVNEMCRSSCNSIKSKMHKPLQSIYQSVINNILVGLRHDSYDCFITK